jgi:hypothetical protein
MRLTCSILPHDNASRLLGMSACYSIGVIKWCKSREEAASFKRFAILQQEENEQDPLMDYLLNLRERMSHAKDLLTDIIFNFILLCPPCQRHYPIAVITASLVGSVRSQYPGRRCVMSTC